jgi:hypothetical protein
MKSCRFKLRRINVEAVMILDNPTVLYMGMGAIVWFRRRKIFFKPGWQIVLFTEGSHFFYQTGQALLTERSDHV